MRITRDIDLAEECAQGAYAQALAAWAEHGILAKPGAWLTTVARRRALDLLRRQDTARRALPVLVTDARAQPGRRNTTRSVAIGLARGPQVGLDALDQLSGDPQLATYSNLAAARADFLRRLGRTGEARDRLHPSAPAHLHHRRTTIPHTTARRTRHQRGHRIPGMTSYRAPSQAHIITCSVPCNRPAAAADQARRVGGADLRATTRESDYSL